MFHFCLNFKISYREAVFKLLCFMLVLKKYFRTSTTAHDELQSYSTSFVQLRYFQMREGNRCLFLNLNPTLIFEKEKSFCAFSPCLKACLPIRNTFWRAHCQSSFWSLFILLAEQLEEVFEVLFVVILCALCWKQEAGARGTIAGCAAVQDSGSCPSARPAPAAAEASRVSS